jgi:cholesterol transport system auxiliary component
LTPPSRINAALRLLASAAMATTLVACSGALSTPPTTFDLRAPSEVKPARGARAQLVVAEPSAVQVLDSDRIVVRPKVGEVSYLSGAQWADRLPKLVQVRLIQTFENAKRIGSVGSPDDKLSADATLVTEIRTFEVGVAESAVATVEISAKLVSESNGRIIAANLFRASVPARGTAGPQASEALDEALQSVLRGIVGWASARV